MFKHPRATAYVVLPFGGYPDTASDYVECATRAEVEAQLVDLGYLDNAGLWVYTVVGQTPAEVIAELVASGDPYPDWIVEFSRGRNPRWTRA